MKSWFLILWLLWPDGTMERGEYGPYRSWHECLGARHHYIAANPGAVVMKAVCERDAP